MATINRQQELAEILNSVKVFPLSHEDLIRLVENYGIDVNFHDDNERAVIYYDNSEYHFGLNLKTNLYEFKMEVGKE